MDWSRHSRIACFSMGFTIGVLLTLVVLSLAVLKGASP